MFLYCISMMRASWLWLVLLLLPRLSFGQSWDTRPDTWAATDGLGRVVPGYEQVGGPRKDRFVGVFYFLWSGSFQTGGPFDVSEILKAHPGAMSQPTVPPWGPYYAPHHWGLSRFGYYVSDDEYVLRKHAQMLSDAGVDVIIFDTSNDVTYKSTYMKLLQVFSEVRAAGGRTPQIAFLTPFGTPGRVVHELFHDLYEPGIYKDLWFRWKGKPLILADPNRLGDRDRSGLHETPIDVEAGGEVASTFVSAEPVSAVAAEVATYAALDSEVTVSLYRGSDRSACVGTQRFTHVPDNGFLKLRFGRALPAGTYTLVLSKPRGRVAWWTHSGALVGDGQAYKNGQAVDGRVSVLLTAPSSSGVELEDFFTFRAPQPSYFEGPIKPDMWSWLEVYPQHVFTDSKGHREQMSVGVAQNAVGGRLGSMSEIGAHGRAWHDGANDTTPGAVDRGLNFAEQAEWALKQDPEFVFITGWNEWVAGRFPEFAGVKLPVMFVDEFNQEFSRDIEPMVGGHGDNYYYQMVSFIRRYKGVRPLPVAGPAQTIDLAGGFDQWKDVGPSYRDDVGDATHRDHVGWSKDLHYVNQTGRNDFVELKVSRDDAFIYFYARTKDPITPYTDPHWMMLFLKVGASSGWEGYSYVVNRLGAGSESLTLEQSGGGWNWNAKGKVRYRVAGNEMQLAIRREDLGLGDLTKPIRLEFKWMDNMQHEGDVSDFDLVGDAAPNGRFNYVYVEPGAAHS